MDKKKLQKYKSLLDEARREILQESGYFDEPDQDSTGRDQADLAAVGELREHILALSRSEREHLAQIVDALTRIDEGKYGICTGCEQPIPEKRLKAIPHAVLCVECKSRAESQGGGATFSSDTPTIGRGDYFEDYDN